MQNADTQAAVAEEVNSRMENAAREIAAKYAAGKGGVETSESAPTGSAYKEKSLDAAARKKTADKQRRVEEGAAESQALAQQQRAEIEAAAAAEDGIAGAEEGGEDEDYELRMLREQRLRQIRDAQRERIENVSKGHGQYREVVQDEFLAEMVTSERTVCHFYHRDFARCAIMDHHIGRLVGRHLETKFVKIDAEKAPFFIDKLKIRTMPTLVLFFDGVAREKILGFEGLSDKQPEGKEDEWPTIVLARLLGEKGIIDKSKIVDDDGVEAAAKARMEQMRQSIFSGMRAQDVLLDDDDDFDMDNM